jgi:hypothetical protein
VCAERNFLPIAYSVFWQALNEVEPLREMGDRFDIG